MCIGRRKYHRLMRRSRMDLRRLKHLLLEMMMVVVLLLLLLRRMPLDEKIGGVTAFLSLLVNKMWRKVDGKRGRGGS